MLLTFTKTKNKQDGYEARQIAKSAWTKSIMYLSNPQSPDDTSVRFLQSMFSNAMPLPEIPPAAYSFLTRGVHMGALLMIACIAKHLEVPILTLENLQTFFDTDEVRYKSERGYAEKCRRIMSLRRNSSGCGRNW